MRIVKRDKFEVEIIPNSEGIEVFIVRKNPHYRHLKSNIRWHKGFLPESYEEFEQRVRLEIKSAEFKCGEMNESQELMGKVLGIVEKQLQEKV